MASQHLFCFLVLVLRFCSLEKNSFIPEALSFASKDRGLGNTIQMSTSEMYKECNSSGMKLRYLDVERKIVNIHLISTG